MVLHIMGYIVVAFMFMVLTILVGIIITEW